jgi:hypothetical protein
MSNVFSTKTFDLASEQFQLLIDGQLLPAHQA